jgi:hypothetical protein
VYWVPSAPELYHEDQLPTHPALALAANCEQMLCTRYSRRMIAMVKVRRYDAAAAAAAARERQGFVMDLERLADVLHAPRGAAAAAAGDGGGSSSSASARREKGGAMPKYRGKTL